MWTKCFARSTRSRPVSCAPRTGAGDSRHSTRHESRMEDFVIRNKENKRLTSPLMWGPVIVLAVACVAGPLATTHAEQPDEFADTMKRMSAAKPKLMEAARKRLEDRYDLGDKPAAGVTMSRGKPVQSGARVRPPEGWTWEKLAALAPDEVRTKDLYPAGFLPLPHPNHPEGGM